MTETIGKVTLNLDKYPGEDYYCDGSVEDEILEIVKKYSTVEYDRIIAERKSWPILYHLSALRENIVDFLPIKKTDKVLEVGSGCGAITGALSRKAGSVTCVDLSKKRSLINAYRHSESENVTIHIGNFTDVEPDLPADYDYICLIGVFEYGQAYIGGSTPYEDFLKILQKHLAPGGRIVIAIENKYGLKYFAGCKEDHLGDWFSGIENYPNGGVVRTFSRKKLEKIFDACGVGERSFYYPYPDYKFMTTVYSDAYLPGRGELSNNLRNFDRDRMLLFDEKSAFDGIVEEGLFSVFSNSYLAVIGKPLDLKYVRYSNDRAENFRIRTEILRDDRGNRIVRKYPLTKEAEAHVRHMMEAYEKLKVRYAGSRLDVNVCHPGEEDGIPYAEFEFVSGRPLSELMDECLDRQDIEGFHSLFAEYLERVGFGEEVPVADFDLIFANILVDGDHWTLIDYEWTFDRVIDTKALAFRAIYCYVLENERRNALELDRILDCLDITENEARQYREQEREFQKYVTGQKLSMGEIRNLLGGEIYKPTEWIGRFRQSEGELRVQIYEDKGQGFSEENSYFPENVYVAEKEAEFIVKFDGNVHYLRLDPAMCSCICKIRELSMNGQPVPLQDKKVFTANGKILKSEEGADHPSVIFATEDPNMTIRADVLNRQAENTLSVKMEIVQIPQAMAKDMMGVEKKGAAAWVFGQR
jgi:Precorrin-6B methylase 2